jgi:hypothetical protein
MVQKNTLDNLQQLNQQIIVEAEKEKETFAIEKSLIL